MAVLQNKIDFALVFTVKNANPNGDPLNGNIPRLTLDGHGEISDVCLKRKIRNIIILLIIVALAFAGWTYYKKNKSTIGSLRIRLGVMFVASVRCSLSREEMRKVFLLESEVLLPSSLRSVLTL